MPTIATHNSRFHADDLFAVATLIKKFELEDVNRQDIVIHRTRDREVIKEADYVVDVGDEYDPDRQRFDHHMTGGAKDHDVGFPYASFGLVWDEYGPMITGSQEASDIITKKLVLPIDANDNGCNIYERVYEDVAPYILQSFVFAFGPTWREEHERSFDEGFFEMLDIVGAILAREIEQAQSIVEGTRMVEELYATTDDKQIIEMERHYPYEYILPKYAEPLYVIRPDKANDTWKVEALQNEPYPSGYALRKPFPVEWSGKRDEELQEITGVSDALFTHNARFLAVAKSRSGARQLARIAVDA